MVHVRGRMSNHVNNIGASTVKGGLFLLLGNSLALIFDAVGVILVARMLSPSQYGIFTIALVIPNSLKLFTTWGLNQAMIRFIAQQQLVGNSKKIQSIVQAGLITRFVIGGFLSLVLFLSADLLATVVLKKPEVGEYVRIASILMLSHSIYNTSISVFSGLEKMNYYAFVNVIQSVIKCIASPILVYYGFGVLGVILGFTISSVLSAFIGLLLMLTLTGTIIFREKPVNLFSDLTLLLGFGLPIFIGNVISGFSIQFRGFLLSWFVSDEKIGNYGVASYFSTVISVIITTISITLFPVFSKYRIEQSPRQTKEVFIGSIRYTSMVLIPMICLLISVSRLLILSLFGLKYPLAPLYVSLLLAPTLFVGLGTISTYRFLNSQGETRTSMILVIASSFISMLLSLLFIWFWNIEGLLIGLIIASLIRSLIELLVINNKYEMIPDIGHIGRTLICSLSTIGFTMLFQYVLYINLPLVSLFFSSVFYILIYLLLAPILGAINNRDIDNLDSLLSNIIIYPIVRRILIFEKKIVAARNKWKG